MNNFHLNWIFSSGHKLSLEFKSFDKAESHFYACNMLKNNAIERVYIIDGSGCSTWLKEKVGQ